MAPFRVLVPVATDVNAQKKSSHSAEGNPKWGVWTVSQDMSIVATWSGLGELDRILTRVELTGPMLSIGLTALVDMCARKAYSSRLSTWFPAGFDLLFVVDEAAYVRKFGVEGHT